MTRCACSRSWPFTFPQALGHEAPNSKPFNCCPVQGFQHTVQEEPQVLLPPEDTSTEAFSICSQPSSLHSTLLPPEPSCSTGRIGCDHRCASAAAAHQPLGAVPLQQAPLSSASGLRRATVAPPAPPACSINEKGALHKRSLLLPQGRALAQEQWQRQSQPPQLQPPQQVDGFDYPGKGSAEMETGMGGATKNAPQLLRGEGHFGGWMNVVLNPGQLWIGPARALC